MSLARTKWLGLAAVSWGVALIGALALGAPAASAAVDSCPNAEYRTGPSLNLPDCRAYELINPLDKNANLTGSGLISADGNRIFYVIGGSSSFSTIGTTSALVATRTATGWESSLITPPAPDFIGDSYTVNAANADLTSFVATANSGLAQTIGAPTVVRLGPNRQQTELQNLMIRGVFGNQDDILASEDLSRVFGAVQDELVEEHPPDTFQIYDFGSGTPEIVSRMPETDEPAQCGTPLSSNDGFVTSQGAPTQQQHRVSVDGRRVFFSSRGDDCSAQRNLYMRDVVAGESTLISGPIHSGTDFGVERFMQAAADGSWVVYRTRTRYAADDTNTTADVYKYTVGVGNECLTCVVPNANVVAVSSGAFNAIMSQDGSTLYFISTQSLDGKGVQGQRNLYVVRDGELEYVSPADSISHNPTANHAAETTADGDVFVFRSRHIGLNELSGRDNGGKFQYYRFDYESKRVECISCPADRAAEADVPAALLNVSVFPAPGKAMSSDGSIVAFPTRDSLVTEDINGSADIYQWHDGEVGLITDGVVPMPAGFGFEPQLITVSPDGRDILIHSAVPLVPEVFDGHFNLYTARVGGGFPSGDEPVAPCAGDSCQLPEPPAPGRPSLGSAVLEGDGNARSSDGQWHGRVRFKGSRLVGGARVVLWMTAPGRGKLTVSGPHFRRTTRSIPKSGNYRLRVTLTRAARKRLRKGGVVRLRTRAVFRAADGDQSVSRITTRLKPLSRRSSAGKGY